MCGAAYQRGTFDPATEQFSLSNLETPPVIAGNPAISAVIVGGRAPNTGIDDFVIWFFTNDIIFIHAIGNGFNIPLPFPSEGFDCDMLLQLYPIGPKNGDPRIILDCSSMGASRRYELTVNFDSSVLASPRTIDTHGTPIVTPGSEYILLYGETNIIIYRTDDYSTRGSKDLGGTIQEIHILEWESDSGNRLSLVATVAEGPQWLIDVADLVDSGGTRGTTQLGQSVADCPEGGSCLPVRVNSEYLLTFVSDGASYKGLIYDLDSPAQPMEEVPNFLERPDIAFFQVEPLPMPSTTAVPTPPTQSSSQPPPIPTRSSSPIPTPSTHSQEPLPSSTPSLHPPLSVTPSAAHAPTITSSMTSKPTTSSPSPVLEIAVIIMILITVILMVILVLLVLIVIVVVLRRKRRGKRTIEPDSWYCWKKPGKSQEEERDRPRTAGEGEVTLLSESQQQAIQVTSDGQPAALVGITREDPGYSTGTSSPVSDGRQNPSPSPSAGSSLPHSTSNPSIDSSSSETSLCLRRSSSPEGRSMNNEPVAASPAPATPSTHTQHETSD